MPPNKLLINHISTDNQGNIKVSTDFPHSFTLSFKQKSFVNENKVQDASKLGLPIAPIVFSHTQNNYWFWQKRQGYFLYNTSNGKLTSLAEIPGIKGRKKSALIEKVDGANAVYTVLDDTLVVKLHQTDENNISIESVVEIPSSERIHTIAQDHYQNLLIGTQNNLFYYNSEAQKLKKTLANVGRY